MSVRAATNSQQTASTSENVSRFAKQAAQQQNGSATIAYNENTHAAVAQKDKKLVNNLIYLDERAPSDAITIPLQDKVGNDILAMDVEDNSIAQQPGEHVKKGDNAPPGVKHRVKILPKLSFAMYGGPSIYSPIVVDNNRNDGISAIDVKAREQQQYAYNAGVYAGYDISRKLTVQLGVSYRAYRFYIEPSVVYSPSGDVSAAYPIVTSSGTVNMPYISGYSSSGFDTTATAKGSALRSYISIPLRLKYNFVNNGHFKLYMSGGGSANILAYNYIKVHCQNQWGAEDDYMYNISGTRPVNFSFLVGLGAEFAMGRGVKLFVEPSFNGAITATTRNTPVTAYSNYFDFAAGLAYHF
jgi:hypothetical protein